MKLTDENYVQMAEKAMKELCAMRDKKTEIFKEADDTNCEGKWKGNHSFVNDIRNKTTHRNSPDVVAISDYDINLTHPHIFLIIGKQFFPFGKFGNKSVCCFSF